MTPSEKLFGQGVAKIVVGIAKIGGGILSTAATFGLGTAYGVVNGGGDVLAGVNDIRGATKVGADLEKVKKTSEKINDLSTISGALVYDAAADHKEERAHDAAVAEGLLTLKPGEIFE